MLTILGLVVNITWGGGYTTDEYVHFDDEWDTHTSSKYHEENGYEHDLDLVIISRYAFCFVSYPTRKRGQRKSIRIGTLNTGFGVTYYLKLCSAIYIFTVDVTMFTK